MSEPAPAATPYPVNRLDEELPAVNREAVDRALEGFALDLVVGKDMGWLAMAVRRALAITVIDECWGPERSSNADIRAELERLGALARSTWLDLSTMSAPAASRLWDYAYHGGKRRELRRMSAAVAELEWLGSFIAAAAKTTPRQQGPWRQSEAKDLRVERGQYLARIFEAAFGEPVSVNNHGYDARHEAPTAFMDFYSRMVSLAFDRRETTNLVEVLKEACRKHRECPAEFEGWVIPGL